MQAPEYNAETNRGATVIEVSGQIELENTVTVKANKKVCIRATNAVTISRKAGTLTADMLSTNAQEPSEGPIKNLVDGNNSTFFHTPWSYTQEFPQWIQIDFNEPHENFIIGYVNRTDNTWTSDGRPAVVDLQISNDKTEWETVTTLSGLPSSAGSEYTSDFVMPGKTFTSFRFSVTSATGSASYWNMGEFMMYDADVEIYDPETVELD